MTRPSTLPFEEHYVAAVHGLQDGLDALLRSVGADPGQPQEVARQLGLHRNLTWKVSRLVRAEDPFSIYPQIPGESGMRILLEALAKARADGAAIDRVKAAVLEFERMLEIHAGDRTSLELMLDSMASDATTEPLETSRKLAFRGNSGILGIQAKVRLRTMILAPSRKDESLTDVAQITGLLGLRRLRADAAMPLFERMYYKDDGSPMPQHLQMNLEDPPADDPQSLLMPTYCTSPMPPIRTTETERSVLYELGAGPVGNRGTSNLVFGHASLAVAPRFAREPGEHCECGTDIHAPVEHLLVDVLIHRDLVSDPKFDVQVLRGDVHAYVGGRSSPLPCPETLRDLGQRRLRLATPHFPEYPDLVVRAMRTLDRTKDEFQGVRFEMTHPPTPSFVLMRYPLPTAP